MSPVSAVCACGEYFNVNDDGELCLNPGTMGLRERVVFTSVGNHQFTKADYPWLARVKVQVQGGGGGSAGAVSLASQLIARPGAAAGVWAEALIEAGTLGAVETIVVGAGGAGGNGNNGGQAGGSSSFGGVVLAGGGAGGPANMSSDNTMQTASGAGSSSAGTGDIVVGGGGGGSSFRMNETKGVTGDGGDSVLGHGGKGIRDDGPGNAPTGYGAGASGAYSMDRSSQNGTAGGRGIVIVDLYG